MNASAPAPSRHAAVVGYAWVALAASTWGCWPLFLRAAGRVAPVPGGVVSLLVMVGLVVVGALCMTRDRFTDVKRTFGQWMLVAWLGVSDALNNVFFFNAYRTTTVAIAVLTHYLAPLFVALAAPALGLERWRTRTIVAAGGSFLGLVVLLAPWRDELSPSDLRGAFLGAASAVFYASNVLTSKRLVPAFTGSEMTCFHGIVGALVLAFLAPPSVWRALDSSSYVPLALGTLLPGSLACLLFVWGLRRIPASHAGSLTLLEPLVAVLIGAIFFAERIGVLGAAGVALILASAAVVVSKSSDTAQTPEKSAQNGEESRASTG